MKRLLVVDDEQQNLYMLQVLLSANGFDVELASNGAEALERARRAPPDMIISDILMPVMDGFTLCRAWKEDERLKNIPFVFYTATYTDPKDEDFALNLGAERFIVKPVEPDKFLALLREIIAAHEVGKLMAPRQPVEEVQYYKEYNVALIRKLEDKVLQLEEANHALELDIAERKRAEEALRESESKYRILVENIPQKIFTKDKNSVYLSCNENFARDLGITPEEFVGRTDYDFFPNELADKYRADDQRIMETGSTENIEEKYLQNGQEFWVQTIKTPIKDEKGNVIGILGVFWDISDRKHVEEERKRLMAKLAQKNKELEQIVYVTSHDLRSPLVNVQGFSKELQHTMQDLTALLQTEDIPETLRDKVISIMEEDIQEDLKYILTGIAKMDTLLSGLLQLSRLGRAALTITTLDMNTLIAQIVNTFEFQIAEAGVKLEISELPPCKGDVTQINQVLSNLLDNALKYLDPNHPGIIKIYGYQEHERAIYCVEDNGVGIAPEHQEKIFEIFHRFNPTESPGEGLGLTIVRKILERQEGNVWVESEPGKGSKFYVSLPGGEME